MRYKVRPEDFVVEEQLGAALPLAESGPFTIYRVRKRSTTTLAVQAELARQLGLAQADVIFPALKDKEAVAIQHAAVRGSALAHLSGAGFSAQRVGHSRRPLTPTDVSANLFTLVLRDLAPGEDAYVRLRLEHVARWGLPNYFDQQRFGSLAAGEEHIGKRILRRDAEGALRAYLTQRFAGDPEPVRRFKRSARAQWGDWSALFEAAPRPSNYRSVLTYLRDHPTAELPPAERETQYRKALNLVTARLLSLYLGAYQALLWNRIAGRYLEGAGAVAPAAGWSIEIAGEQLPLYAELPPDFERDLAVALPGHTARYATPEIEGIALDVLAREGLTPADLKARILKKAYLPRGERPLLLFPRDVTAQAAEPDEHFPGRQKMTVAFALQRGSYATLVLKALDLPDPLGAPQRK